MKRFVLVAAAVLMSAGVAHADPFAGMYGNTVTITGSDGTKSTAYVNADMTWEQHMAGGAVMKGTYTWKDAGTVCFTLTDPAPKSGDMAPNCSPVSGDHKAGDTWTETSPKGQTMTYSVTAGR
jgi:hypothetical protein